MTRLLLLLPTTTYRTEAFVEAALRLGVELTVASERDSAFSQREPTGLLTLDFQQPERAADIVAEFAARTPIDAVVGIDDDTAFVAAVVSRALGLPHNPVHAMDAARDKHLQRRTLRDHRVPVPDFVLRTIDEPPAAVADETRYPCVLKPTTLAASRGVIRADDPSEFLAAHGRLANILTQPDVQERGPRAQHYLVESYVPGQEFALEGLLVGGQLHVLALFDKPDPLAGPFFEETIYVTPSRAPEAVQRTLVVCANAATAALGLHRGPVHIELRHNATGPWLIELAARPIGGKCGQVLRFGDGGERSLEELVIGQAVEQLAHVPARAHGAAGVMMIPKPGPGVFRAVKGIEKANGVPHVTGVVITAHRGQRLVPLPDESGYLGFIFARCQDPADAEAALRAAHAYLEFEIA